MEIELRSQSDDEMVFIVRDAEVPFINAIRRVAMVNVPKIAIEDVNIIRNDSAMFNEVLAHRLGLTPLVSDLDALEGTPLSLKIQLQLKYSSCSIQPPQAS